MSDHIWDFVGHEQILVGQCPMTDSYLQPWGCHLRVTLTPFTAGYTNDLYKWAFEVMGNLSIPEVIYLKSNMFSTGVKIKPTADSNFYHSPVDQL